MFPMRPRYQNPCHTPRFTRVGPKHHLLMPLSPLTSALASPLPTQSVTNRTACVASNTYPRSTTRPSLPKLKPMPLKRSKNPARAINDEQKQPSSSSTLTESKKPHSTTQYLTSLPDCLTRNIGVLPQTTVQYSTRTVPSSCET